jgi:predicted porin
VPLPKESDNGFWVLVKTYISQAEEKTMNKKLISIAVGAALTAGTVVAQAAEGDAMPKVYGKAHVSYGAVKVDETNAGGTSTTTTDNIQFADHNSRIGVKGAVPITDSLKGTYGFEWAIDFNANDRSNRFTYRNQYVGLKGGFGHVLFGRYDTPTKKAQGKFDEFNDTYGDFASIVLGDKRLDNTVNYLSPDWGGFSFSAQIIPGEGNGEDNGGGDGPLDTFSLAAKYKVAGLFISAGFDAYDSKAPVTADYDGYESLMRVIATYGNKMFQVGGMYEDAKGNSIGGVDLANDKTSMGVSGHVAFAGVHKVKLQYLMGTEDITGGDTEQTQFSVGYDYKMGKATTVYALVNAFVEERKASGDEKTEESQVAIGIVQKW